MSTGPLAAALAAQPAAPALRWPGGGWSYRELDQRAAALAGWLRGLGVRRGCRVALAAPSSPDYLALLLALPRLGAVFCPVNPRWPSALLAAALAHAGVTWLLSPTVPDTLPATCRWQAWPEPLDQGPDIPEDEWPDELALNLIFTSGSAGPPKAASHTWGNHRLSALGSASNLPLGPGDGWLLSLPLFHVGGLAIPWRCWLAGATVLLPADPRAVADALAALNPSHLSLVPTQLYRLLRQDHGPAILARVRALLLGGAASPATLLDEAARLGLPLHQSYGLTEMASQVCTTAPGAGRAAWASAGRVLPHRELRVAEDGELWLRGGTLFQGYQRAAGLDPARDAAGWFHSGDLGYLNEQQGLVITGRRDRLLITGGENVHPESIEAALLSLPAVLEAAVVAQPDAEFGERPVAFITLQPGQPWAPERLLAALAERLPRHALPIALHPLPESTRSGLKVDLRKLAALVRAGGPLA